MKNSGRGLTLIWTSSKRFIKRTICGVFQMCNKDLSCMDLSGVWPRSIWASPRISQSGADFYEMLITGLKLFPLSCIFKPHHLSCICSHAQSLPSTSGLALHKSFSSSLPSSSSCLTFGAVGVLQAETGLVALGHLGPIEGQQVIVGEDLDAVVVPEGRDQGRKIIYRKGRSNQANHQSPSC